ncbi:MAG: hypothetical protein MJE66_14375 [Proteobacteria bacterium]|nr:hypothetical protein [Pseudomonadota bacterium]
MPVRRILAALCLAAYAAGVAVVCPPIAVQAAVANAAAADSDAPGPPGERVLPACPCGCEKPAPGAGFGARLGLALLRSPESPPAVAARLPLSASSVVWPPSPVHDLEPVPI